VIVSCVSDSATGWSKRKSLSAGTLENVEPQDIAEKEELAPDSIQLDSILLSMHMAQVVHRRETKTAPRKYLIGAAPRKSVPLSSST
jgi:hypothetical protein